MPKYVFCHDRGVMVDKETGLPMLNQEERARPLQMPRVFGDYPAYQSPVTGEWIEGKQARKEDLKKHGCVDGLEFGPAKPRKLKNPRFAKKHGLEHLLE